MGRRSGDGGVGGRLNCEELFRVGAATKSIITCMPSSKFQPPNWCLLYRRHFHTRDFIGSAKCPPEQNNSHWPVETLAWIALECRYNFYKLVQ